MVFVIIGEKPDATMHIAKALADGRPTVKESKYGVKYYEFKRGKDKFVAVCAVGHLFNLKQIDRKIC